MTNTHMKRNSTSVLIMEMKPPQWEAITHPPEWLVYKRLTTHGSLLRVSEAQRKLLGTTPRNKTDNKHFRLSVRRHLLIIRMPSDLEIPLSGIEPTERHIYVPQKDISQNLYSCIIGNTQNLQTAQVPSTAEYINQGWNIRKRHIICQPILIVSF